MKFNNIRKALAGAFAAAAIAAVPTSASAVPVGLELLLLADVSGSVDNTEYNLQKTGYVQAFQSAAVQNAIAASVKGAIAVQYVEWSGQGEQSVKVGWTLINDADSANAFAAAIAASTRTLFGLTAIQDAMLWGGGQFANNGFEGDRLVIDVSGDGSDNATSSCNRAVNAACGRDAALLAGVHTINGLPIGGGDALTNYYTNNVKGGAGAFVLAAADFAAFQAAIENKLIREITQVPEPGSIALLGLGLFGLAAIRRRKSA